MKRVILGMSKDKKSTLAPLESKTPELIDTLIKLYLYPNHESTKHWRHEIATSINRVPKLKSSNKFPKEKDILKNTWYIWEDCLLDWIEPIQVDYGKVNYNINTEGLYYACKLYFEWLAHKLSTKGIVAREDIYEKLKNLGF